MGRIRTVKPELFIHDELYDAEHNSGLPCRLAFIGLLTLVDREGRFHWKPRQIKAQLFPYDELEFSQVLEALKNSGFLTHYQVEGKQYGVIKSFANHQKINAKEAKSKLPAPENGEEIKPEPPLTERNSSEKVIPVNSGELHSRTPEGQENFSGEGIGIEIGDLGTELEHGTEHGRELCLKDPCRVDTRPDADEQTGEVILSSEPLPEATDPKARASSQQKQARAIDDIFQYWQTIMDHPNARLDEKRRKLIRNALKTGYAVNDLKTAILGCSYTPHNMGDNDRGQRYDGLHVIFKNADQIDRFIHNAMNQESMDANRENHQRGKNGLTFFDRDLTGTLDELWEKS